MAKQPIQTKGAAPRRSRGRPASDVAKQTKKQIALSRKQAKQNRIIWLSVAGLCAIVLALVIVMVIKQIQSHQPKVAAVVDGTRIWESDLTALSRVISYSIQNDLSSAMEAKSALDTTDTYYEYYAAAYDQQISQLEYQQANVAGLALDSLVDSALVEKKAQESGISVTEEEVTQEFRRQWTPPTPTPYPTGTVSATLPTATPLPQELIDANYQARLQEVGITDADNRKMIRRSLLATKLQELLASQVVTTGLVADIQVIQTDTEEAAAAAEQRVKAGEDFTAVAKEVSTDTATKDLGGALGWVIPDQVTDSYGADVETIAFSLNAGEVGRAASNGKFYLVRLVDRNENGPLPAAIVEQRRQSALTDWLTKRKAEVTIEQYVLTPTPTATVTPLPLATGTAPLPTQTQAPPAEATPPPSATP